MGYKHCSVYAKISLMDRHRAGIIFIDDLSPIADCKLVSSRKNRVIDFEPAFTKKNTRNAIFDCKRWIAYFFQNLPALGIFGIRSKGGVEYLPGKSSGNLASSSPLRQSSNSFCTLI